MPTQIRKNQLVAVFQRRNTGIPKMMIEGKRMEKDNEVAVALHFIEDLCIVALELHRAAAFKGWRPCSAAWQKRADRAAPQEPQSRRRGRPTLRSRKLRTPPTRFGLTKHLNRSIQQTPGTPRQSFDLAEDAPGAAAPLRPPRAYHSTHRDWHHPE